MKIWGLPGFLGTREDFEPLWRGLREEGLVFSRESWSASTDVDFQFSTWSEWREKTENHLRSWSGSEALVGIGYSLGGRLLLSLAAQAPDLFDGLVFLSTNPGISEADRIGRLAHDETWARRFESESWSSLMNDWNSQTVFKGSRAEPARKESDYARERLALLLREFSLGKQPDFRSWAAESKIPQLWMSGEKDEKFVSILNDLQARSEKNKGTIRFEIVPSSSHRILFEQPDFIRKRVAEFVRASSIC